MITTINPSDLAPPFGNYSHAVVFSEKKRMLKTSGQLAIDLQLQIPDSTFDQSTLIFNNLEKILLQANMARENIIHLGAYVTDRAYMKEYMRARDDFFTGFTQFPASTLLIVSGFTKPEFKVEIEITAVSD